MNKNFLKRWAGILVAGLGVGSLVMVFYSQAQSETVPAAVTSPPPEIPQLENLPTPTLPTAVPPLQPAQPTYTAVNEFSHHTFQIDSRRLFHPQPLPNLPIRTAPSKLLRVLRNTRTYFAQYGSSDPVVQRDGILAAQGVTLTDVLNTLDFMIATLTEDISKKQPIRLLDSQFINQNFRVMAWKPYNPRNPQQTEKLRLTKYAVFTHRGSRTRTATYNVALYALPPNANQDYFYRQYTKQQVIAGIYEPGGQEYGRVQPIAYLTRAAFEDALMQGTILIQFPDGSASYFNVDRNNNIAFVKGLEPYHQKRYWYFREVKAIKGYGSEITNKIDIEPEVTFAGDVYNIGLGRVILLEDQAGGGHKLRLGVIADTGGAFIPNLYQLDFLTGVFPSRQDFQNYIYQLPEFVKAYILIKK
ncbi:hypothetical protein RIF25_11705 [Thermosynechococcaceae cyanobacterium BACA0444]|uniref:POLO box domain-containing protein n=1 Tax=Pseudocalidococcus azoricus BACA0444 TaxID=2918990 RepID=A0AAE4FUV2_9CYAN|nr:hypothetical protein [Pseudocalidococcus azoricus]MDS3861471.1 hypothetical protein [Pseudocalidococcus azoricus BACA0444]